MTTIPVPPNLSEKEKLLSNVSCLPESEIFKKWIEYFAKGGIFAKESFPEFENAAIQVWIYANKDSFMEYVPKDKINGALVIYALKRNGKFDLYRTYGENYDSIFKEWHKEMKSSDATTWQDMYFWARKLVERYSG